MFGCSDIHMSDRVTSVGVWVVGRHILGVWGTICPGGGILVVVPVQMRRSLSVLGSGHLSGYSSGLVWGTCALPVPVVGRV